MELESWQKWMKPHHWRHLNPLFLQMTAKWVTFCPSIQQYSKLPKHKTLLTPIVMLKHYWSFQKTTFLPPGDSLFNISTHFVGLPFFCAKWLTEWISSSHLLFTNFPYNFPFFLVFLSKKNISLKKYKWFFIPEFHWSFVVNFSVYRYNPGYAGIMGYVLWMALRLGSKRATSGCYSWGYVRIGTCQCKCDNHKTKAPGSSVN